MKPKTDFGETRGGKKKKKTTIAKCKADSWLTRSIQRSMSRRRDRRCEAQKPLSELATNARHGDELQSRRVQTGEEAEHARWRQNDRIWIKNIPAKSRRDPHVILIESERAKDPHQAAYRRRCEGNRRQREKRSADEASIDRPRPTRPTSHLRDAYQNAKQVRSTSALTERRRSTVQRVLPTTLRVWRGSDAYPSPVADVSWSAHLLFSSPTIPAISGRSLESMRCST